VNLSSTEAEVVIVRGGGLGDFLLTLPLLYKAVKRYDAVHLFTRTPYFQLLGEAIKKKVQLYNLDACVTELKAMSEGRDVVSFWNDSAWIKELEEAGANKIKALNPRPQNSEHFVSGYFNELQWRADRHVFNHSWLGDRWNPKNQTLWVHPGSGSREKNAPVDCFLERASTWLEKKQSHRVVFSFGEADLVLMSEIKSSPIAEQARCTCYEISCLKEFLDSLANEAGCFVGNDSGPTHMAAMLGIPTEVIFVSTDARIWKPLGPRVKLLGGE